VAERTSLPTPLTPRPGELIHRADVAMYAAKASGKGRVQEFVPGLLQGALSRVPAES
jgi:predicted signal transduction protein with EAL and GGDEF domain